ncbi:ankyrin repeat domain-containing protein [Nocardioides sp. AE5]|uniref:ankyrin repeat domain-containing protein n=1 Tax=Nocardioides sp. AE5 TaxID=2962573 RepID=UPI0028810F26|nr:ankyrin repeat domain-containing protein [Nocardioides sp. AE5]MDT0202457.1 ankyrin repeat domain-containing protein [Nocardioides sp. AE5]
MARKRKTLPKDFADLLKGGDLDALKAVFDTCAIDARGGYDKGTALSFPDCPDELARWLVDQGLDVDEPSQGSQHTPLQARASSWKSIAALIELGADVNRTDKYGKTPMHLAAKRPDQLKLLIEAGAEVDPVYNRGITPLRSALISCSNAEMHYVAESAAVLLAAGAAVPDNAEELITRIGTNFEFHRSNFNSDLIDETEAGLHRLYDLFGVTPVAPRVVHDGTSRIEVTATDVAGQYDELWTLLVPSQGPAGNIQGEVLRLAGKLAREISGNGSINWDSDFRTMTDVLGAHLASGNPVASTDDLAPVLKRIKTGNAPERDLAQLREAAVAWILANPDPTPLPPPAYQR